MAALLNDLAASAAWGLVVAASLLAGAAAATLLRLSGSVAATLGLTVAQGEVGLALAAGILIGNLVEAYGAAQPILAGGRSPRFAVGLLGGLGVVLMGATVLGGTVLAGASEELIGVAQAVAAGALLAVVSVAIVPHAFAEVSSRVATAIVLGFVLGYVLSRGRGAGAGFVLLCNRP